VPPNQAAPNEVQYLFMLDSMQGINDETQQYSFVSIVKIVWSDPRLAY